MKIDSFNGLKSVIMCGLSEDFNESDADYRLELISVMHALNKILDYENFNEYCSFLSSIKNSNQVNKNIEIIRNKILSILDKVQINDELSKTEMINFISRFLDPQMFDSYVSAIDDFSSGKQLTLNYQSAKI